MAASWDRKALCDYGGASYIFGELAANIGRLHILFESVVATFLNWTNTNDI